MAKVTWKNESKITPEKFDSWMKTFKKSNQNRGSFPKNNKAWFSHVQKVHAEFIKTFQSIGVTKRVTISDEVASVRISSDVADYIYYIKSHIPNYLKTYGLQDEDLCGKYVDGVKISKHISAYAKKQKIEEYDIEEIKSYLSYIKTYSNEQKSVVGQYLVTMSIDPRSFVSLGHMYADDGSCFGQYHGNPDKYILGCVKNSIVLIIRKVGEPNKIIGRAWGIYEKDFAHINNIYCKTINQLTCKMIFEKFFTTVHNKHISLIEEHRNEEDYDLNGGITLDTDGMIYVNSDPHYRFIWNSKSKKAKTEYLYPNLPSENTLDKLIKVDSFEDDYYPGEQRWRW